jgi:hypothetical protein
LPRVTYADAMTLHFDGETVQLFHPPTAHTDNDTLVHFKRANVIHASGTIGGDGGYPFFDMSSGGSLAGMIVAEDKMLSLSDDNTRIVADEGDPASQPKTSTPSGCIRETCHRGHDDPARVSIPQGRAGVALSQELRTVHPQLGQELVEVCRKAIEVVGQHAARGADLRSHWMPLRHPL